MSKPEDISQEVWDAATTLVFRGRAEWAAGLDFERRVQARQNDALDIARAILVAEQRAKERAAAVCRAQAKLFMSTEYAADQPMGSHLERFACDECAKAILASPSQGVTDAV